MPRKILIVDDNDINRTMLGAMLSQDYDILEAKNGEEALSILNSSYKFLSAVLLDIVMPVMDGYEVLKKIHANPVLSQIPIIVTTGNTDGDTEIEALKLGANDFITKPYIPDVIKHRLKNTINLRETAATVNALQRDRLTGLYTREAFFQYAETLIHEQPAGYYVMACFDIDSFKIINDQYGNDKGDQVLKQVAKTFQSGFDPVGGLVGRITADNFAVLYPKSLMDSTKHRKIRETASVLDGSIPPISFSIGRYIVDDLSLPASSMYDRAVLAASSIKGRFDEKIAVYNESMLEHLVYEQTIVNDMKQAITDRQFEVWLQPQYNHSTGALIGAEALVRWQHPQKGLIQPGSFIPIFERNGFVYELDKYVWEQTCALLRQWLDAGISPLPVSVNVSRYDVFRDDLIDVITSLVHKYDIPIDLLRLEITETAFAKSTERIIGVVRDLIANGFTVEIDDFGSGYSSLNTLKDVPAQIIKLDMRFLENGGNSGRGGNILESIVRMTKWLGMAVIAEGVETIEQADYLKSIGCNYVQGYLYAKPMPRSDYETLVQSIGREEKLLLLETVENMDNNAFWDPKSMDTLIFNTYVGGACIFEWHNERIEILRANEKYAKMLGGEKCTVEDALNLKWEEHMDAAAAEATRNAIEETIETGDDATYEAVYHNLFGSDGETHLRTTFRVIARTTGRYLLYATNENLTAQYKAELEKNRAVEQLKVIMDNISSGVTAVVVEEGVPHILFANEQFYAMLGYTKEQFDKEVDNPHNLTHPDDRQRVSAETAEVSRIGAPATIVYRVMPRDGSIRWWQSNITIISLPGIDAPVQLAVANDVTALREAEQRERETSERMQAIMDNAGSGITAVILKGSQVEFLFANDRYYEINGYTKEQYEAEVKETFKIIHPDDRDWVIEAVQKANEKSGSTSIEYRVIRRDNEVAWVRTIISARIIEGIDHPVQFSVITDITAEKMAAEKMLESAEQLRFLNDTAGDLLLRSDVEGGINSVLNKVLEYFGAERAYIFEYKYDEGICQNSYEICKPGIESSDVKYHHFPLERAKNWLRAFETSRFYFVDISDPNNEDVAEEREVFESLGVKSTLAVSLRAEGRVIGTMGVFNPTLHLTNFDNLAAVGDYMAVILTRRDLNARIASDSQNLQDMMNDMPGAFARLRVLPDGSLATEYANENMCRLQGMTFEEIVAADREDVMHTVHPDDQEMVRSTVAQIIATGETRNIQYRLRQAGGRFIPVNAFGRVTRNEAGEVFINAYYTDLTEQEKRDFTLREMMPHLLSAIMRYSTDLVFAKDKDFNYICCSPAFVKFTRQKTESDVIGKNDYDFWTKEEADHFRGDDERLINLGEPLIDYIEPIPSDDGIQHYCRTSKYILRDGAGEIIGMYGIGRDITEERNAYEQLKLLTNSIPGGIASYEISPEGMRITYFNDGFCNMFGYTREEYAQISSTGITNITFEEDIPIIMEQAEALRRYDTPINCDYRVHTKDGGFKWVNCRGSKAEERGDSCNLNVVLFDVTEAKLAEEANLIHEQEMRLAISQMGRMLCEYDPVNRTLAVPEDFAAQYGVSPTVTDVPESLIAAGTITKETLPAFRAFYDAIHRGDKTGSAEYCDRLADGSIRWERVEFSNIFDSKGQPVKTLISVEDTTEMHMRFELERQRPMMGEENLIAHALFNLTTGETLEYAYRDGQEVPVDDRTALGYGVERIDTLLVDDEEREQYRAFNDTAALLERFENGETELSFDYRRYAPNKEIIWVRNIMRMVLKPGSDEVLLFDYFYNVEDEKTREQMNATLINDNYEYVARIYGQNRHFVVMISEAVKDGLIPEKGDDFDRFSAAIVDARVYPDDREMVLRNVLVDGIKKNLEASGRFQFIFRIIAPDGEIRHKKVTQYYIDRQRDIIIFTREDITGLMREEARKAEMLEEALKAANEESRVMERRASAQLKAIMNNVDGGMSAATLIDGEIGYLFVNDAYYSMFGYTKEQFESELPRGLVDIIHPDDLQLVYDMAEKSASSGTERWEFRVIKRDGSLIWVRTISSTCEIEGIDAPVHIAVLIDISKEREIADNLRISEEQFRIAATIGGRRTARYDIKNGIYHHDDDALNALGFGKSVENVPQSFIDAGCIMPETVSAYLEFYEKIRRGEKNCSADVAIQLGDGSYQWSRGDAVVIFDGAGEPSQAIIVFTDITELREKEAVYIKWQQSLEQRPKETYTMFRCNLSKSASFDSVEGSLLRFKFNTEASNFDERTLEYANSCVFPEDREEYIAFLDSDTLLANYYRGKRIDIMEYRESMPEGEPCWRRLTVELVEYPNSSDVEAYLMFEDIDAEKKDELLNIERAQTDPLTGILNRAAFAQAVESIMAGSKSSESLAFMMLDIDGFKLINDTFGHARGDQVLKEIADSLSGVLRSGDVLGRLGGDEFLICLRDMPDDKAIQRKASQICTLLNKALTLDVFISASIGIAVYPRDGSDFETLYRKMDTALYMVKDHGKNNYAFYTEGMTGEYFELTGEENHTDMLSLAVRRKKRRILVVDDQQITLAMLSKMFEDEFTIETARDGKEALALMRRYGIGIACVLLDLVMPGMDGFAVLEKMRNTVELQSIPVVVVSSMDEQETSLRTIKCGAADFVTKPVNPDLLRLRVQSAISRAESDRLRAQNSMLLLHNTETAKYRTALESAGAAVIEYEPASGLFLYDPGVEKYVDGEFDDRTLWEILSSAGAASAEDAEKIRRLVENAAAEDDLISSIVTVVMRTPSQQRHTFQISAKRRIGSAGFPDRIVLTLFDIGEAD